MNKLMVTLSLLLLTVTVNSYSQSAQSFKRHKIALFVPLYLDSAFNSSNDYNYGKLFPKFLSPGLEFYEGAQLALDSLEKEGASFEVTVYDTRGGKNITQMTAEPRFEGTELIIAHVSSPNEISSFAHVATEKGIPFINANLPNDGAVTHNPDMVVLNSTLRTHCESIYHFLQKNHSTARIIVFQKPGTQENILRSYFNEMEKNTVSLPLKLKFITLNNNFTAQQLASYLDSTEVTYCIGASLDENFARTFCQQLASIAKLYPVQVIGMPTWDAIPFEKKEFTGLEISYTTPFYSDRTDKASTGIINHFRDILYSRPSDMVFRGYECIYHFGKLLIEYGPNLNSSLGEKKYKVFTDFDIQPVFLKGPTQGIDYFENKKLYFVKKINGEIKGIYF